MAATAVVAAPKPWFRPLAAALGVTAVGVVSVVAWNGNNSTRVADEYGFEIVARFPHDPGAYTQGLLFESPDTLLESTGLRGKSTLRRVELKTGRVVQQYRLDDKFFGEGIAICGDRLLQLTWESRTGFIYDRKSLRPQSSFEYMGEGWGLTCDGRQWIMSDGTPVLRFLDKETLQVRRKVTVRDGGRRVTKLNELEYIEGEIWANIWYSDHIARISPRDGRVLSWVDLSDLYPEANRRDADQVLNGIAYEPTKKRIVVTGKNWPEMFEIRVVPPAPNKNQE